jgi:hypothetical protein
MHSDTVRDGIAQMMDDALFRSRLAVLSRGQGTFLVRDPQGKMHHVEVVVDEVPTRREDRDDPDDAVLAEQQEIADQLHALGVEHREQEKAYRERRNALYVALRRRRGEGD